MKQEARNHTVGETIKMITKDELISAWDVISQFCEEQLLCTRCPLVNTCLVAFGTNRIETCAKKVVGYLSGLDIKL